jgi:hypothetical protein
MKKWRVVWGGFLALGTFVISHVLGFLVAPPPEVPTEAKGFWLGAGLFLAASIVALMEFLARRFAAKKYRWYWFSTAFVALVAAISLFYGYHKKYTEWTIEVWGRSILKGDAIMPAAQEYMKRNSQRSLKDVIADFQFKTDAIWTRISLKRRAQSLGVSYLIGIAIGTICFCATGNLRR